LLIVLLESSKALKVKIIPSLKKLFTDCMSKKGLVCIITNNLFKWFNSMHQKQLLACTQFSRLSQWINSAIGCWVNCLAFLIVFMSSIWYLRQSFREWRVEVVESHKVVRFLINDQYKFNIARWSYLRFDWTLDITNSS